jgi:hypothetical protein
MSDIRVIIAGKVADLPQNGLNLPLTYSIKSRDGLAINTGSKSEYSFELPATKVNDDIFNRFYDTGTISQSQQLFLDASIEVDGMPFFIGKCQLQSVTLRQDAYSWQGKAYKVAFFGNNADWVILIGDLRIYQLSFTAHIYSYLDNLAAWAYDYPASDYKYLPLKLKDYTTFGQLDSLEDSHPALFVIDILNKIYNSIGYTIESDFFNTDFAQKLILPVPILNRYLSGTFGEEYLNIKAEIAVINYSGLIGTLVYPTQTVFPTIGPNPYNNTTGIYTAPYLGFYLFNAEVILTNMTIPVSCTLGFSVNGAGAVDTWGSLGAAFLADTIIRAEQLFYLNAGDTVEVVMITGLSGIGSYDFASNLTVIGEAEVSDGVQMNLKYVIDPSLKAIDFIKGIAHAFNLCFDTDEGSRRVYIEPSDLYVDEERNPSSRSLEDGFYNSSKDLTSYVDLSKGGELVSDTKMNDTYRLKWKDDGSDPTVAAINENQNLGILEARYLFPTNRYKNGEIIIENPFFAPTLVLADNEIREATSTKTPMIPFIWSVNYFETSTSADRPTELLPRLLVSEKFVGIENGNINVYDGTGVASYPAPLNYMIDYNDTEGYQMSLSFADEQVNGFQIGGLLKRFYLSEMLRLQAGKYLEVYLNWNIIMLQNLTFREKIILAGDKYILQEINSFNVSKKGSTKTFLKYDYNEPDGDDNIQNTILIAKVNL